MHCIHIGLAPKYLSDCVSTVSAASGRYRLRSTGSEAYILPRTRTRFGKRGFFYSGPAAWNTLPSDLHDITDTSTFPKRLKNVLFDRAFNWFLDVSYSSALQILRWLIDWFYSKSNVRSNSFNYRVIQKLNSLQSDIDFISLKRFHKISHSWSTTHIVQGIFYLVGCLAYCFYMYFMHINVHVSGRSVLLFNKLMISATKFCCKFPAEFNSKMILKIGQQLAKLRTNNAVVFTTHTGWIMTYSRWTNNNHVWWALLASVKSIWRRRRRKIDAFRTGWKSTPLTAPPSELTVH